jgi:hypothetical protein
MQLDLMDLPASDEIDMVGEDNSYGEHIVGKRMTVVWKKGKKFTGTIQVP